jgi:hypothetical protein
VFGCACISPKFLLFVLPIVECGAQNVNVKEYHRPTAISMPRPPQTALQI